MSCALAGELLQGWRVFPLQLEDLSAVPWKSTGTGSAYLRQSENGTGAHELHLEGSLCAA